MNTTLPKALIAVIAEALAFVYSHSSMDQLMEASGVEMETPQGNKIDKAKAYLRAVSESEAPLTLLGAILEEFLDRDWDVEWASGQREHKAKVLAAFEKFGYTYSPEGVITKNGRPVGIEEVHKVSGTAQFNSIKADLERIMRDISSDPGAALTGACSLLESALKLYIEDNSLEKPQKQEVKKLWNVVSQHIGFDPAKVEDDDVKKILVGMASIVDGLAAFRTHASSAHGRGRLRYKVEPRHAFLSVSASLTLVNFIAQTWERKRSTP